MIAGPVSFMLSWLVNSFVKCKYLQALQQRRISNEASWSLRASARHPRIGLDIKNVHGATGAITKEAIREVEVLMAAEIREQIWVGRNGGKGWIQNPTSRTH